MELNKAINKCKAIVKVNNDFLKDSKQTINQEEIQAIDTVLNELNNRIPIKDVEEILEQLYRGKPLLDENGSEIGKRYEYMAIHYLENLLNKE